MSDFGLIFKLEKHEHENIAHRKISALLATSKTFHIHGRIRMGDETESNSALELLNIPHESFSSNIIFPRKGSTFRL